MEAQDAKRISVAIIARNEEACIGRCLASTSDFSERVVVDTGSTDATQRIARDMGCRVLQYKWNDNFSEARNFAKSKCKGDWILSIDADEILEDQGADKCRRAIETWEERKDWPTVHVCVHSPLGTVKYYVPRLFKNLDWVYWKGAAHNYLNVRKGPRSDINILGGYSPAHIHDEDRSIRILLKELQKNPGLVREKYYLAREYCWKQLWDEALPLLKEHVEKCTFLPERSESYLLQAKVWRMKNCGYTAETCALLAATENPEFKEAWDFLMMYQPNNEEYLTNYTMADDSQTLFIRLRKWHNEPRKV